MNTVEDRLAALGYVLPEPLQLPPGVTMPFPLVRVIGTRAIISGHGPTDSHGNLAQPFGKVGLSSRSGPGTEPRRQRSAPDFGRIGDTVRRPIKERAAFVHALLNHLIVVHGSSTIARPS